MAAPYQGEKERAGEREEGGRKGGRKSERNKVRKRKERKSLVSASENRVGVQALSQQFVLQPAGRKTERDRDRSKRECVCV